MFLAFFNQKQRCRAMLSHVLGILQQETTLPFFNKKQQETTLQIETRQQPGPKESWREETRR